MIIKNVVAAVAAASVIGIGTLGVSALAPAPTSAAAQTSTSVSSTAGTTTSNAATDTGTTMLVAADTKRDRTGERTRLRHMLHGTWVTAGAGTPVTHQAIRGEVTAVSSTSITVKAKDGFSLTFAVTAETKVRAHSKGSGTDSTIGAVKVGAKALVTGVGASDPSAKHVAVHS